jgi:hypothetical protein
MADDRDYDTEPGDVPRYSAYASSDALLNGDDKDLVLLHFSMLLRTRQQHLERMVDSSDRVRLALMRRLESLAEVTGTMRRMEQTMAELSMPDQGAKYSVFCSMRDDLCEDMLLLARDNRIMMQRTLAYAKNMLFVDSEFMAHVEHLERESASILTKAEELFDQAARERSTEASLFPLPLPLPPPPPPQQHK